MLLKSLVILIYGSFTIWLLHGVRTLWRRKGVWRGVLFWIGAAVAAYVAFIAWIAGPGENLLNRLPLEVVGPLVMVFAITVLLALIEVIFNAMDGPLPLVKPVRVYRPKVYPRAALAAAVLAILFALVRWGPEKWRENLGVAAFVTALISVFTLWFSHYKARRFDYGMAALMADSWVHWEYKDGELDAFTGLDPKAAQETWIGPAGLIYVGDFAPWNFSVYKLISAEATLKAPARITFTFKKTGMGNSTAEDVMRVAIPNGRAADLAGIDRQLRTLCPSAKVALS